MPQGPLVVVVGSANIDLVFQVEQFPRPGETLPSKSFATHPGGKGANQAVAVAKLGGSVRFIGKVGTDAFGDLLLDSVGAAGVDTSMVGRTSSAPTGTASIIVDASGQNQIVVVAGANGTLVPDEAARLVRGAPSAKVVLCQLETPVEAVGAAFAAAPAGAIKILNPAPATNLERYALAGLTFVTPNETETEALTGVYPADQASCEKAARVLMEHGVQHVVITLGERGCFWAHPGGFESVPSIPVRPLDTTAAGDAFSGALAHFLSVERPIPEALRLACRAGALCVTKHGAQESMPTAADVEG